MHRRPAPSRRGFLLTTAGAGAALGLAAGPASAGTRPRPHPFGRYGSPARRRTPKTLYVDPHGRGDFTSVQAAVTAAEGDGWTLVLAPGTYRETVTVDADRTG
ncbi:twin-arginine translocation signal domain-containing protein, partial [Streptomyces olivaceus]